MGPFAKWTSFDIPISHFQKFWIQIKIKIKINYYSIWIFNIHISHLRLLTMIIASSKWQYIHIFANFTCIESKRSPIWSLLLKPKPIMDFIKNDFMYWLQP
jgi:hypothetical protein